MTGVGTMTKKVSNKGLDLAFIKVNGLKLDLMAMKPASLQMVNYDSIMKQCYRDRGFKGD